MELKKKILVIINPISGAAHRDYMPEIVNRNLDSERVDVYVRFTQGPGHATEMAKKAIEHQFDGVIAIGGDGTINETASALINSPTALGIVPCGSGNGLARHLGIPLIPERALKIINDWHTDSLDYCTVNDIPFFCTCGVGFDATVSEKFAAAKRRGPISYAKNAIIEYLNYRSQEYVIKTHDSDIAVKAFVIACGNASQYGNNAFITPNASMQDGLIDVTLIQPFTPLDTAVLGILLFTKHIDQDTNIQSFRTPSLTIHRPKAGVMHIDGEPMMMEADIEVKCVHNGIKIFLPKDGGENKKTFITPIEEGFWNFVTTVRSELNI